MSVGLQSLAEQRAQEAEALSAFGGLNLLHIKRQLALLLQQIGGQGVFDEYTRHDISHIDAMLTLLTECIIPPRTLDVMPKADWLIVVLSIYFHDLGMLVTKSEYNNRHKSGFPLYRDTILFSDDDNGQSYRAKVSSLRSDEAERFLYQEFVRHLHAKRIKYWLISTAPQDLGVNPALADSLNDLLMPLDQAFRNDLAQICESHHLDDLDDFSKYKVSQPYGPTHDETANLQYAAILLRTADLLHITRDRTPSIVFRVLSPADPISQIEWAKQMAVRSVRSQIARDREGNADPDLPRSTIEVHAHFTNENGFFGLTSYLDYAEKQLKQSHEWASVGTKKHAAPHQFPWRHIDQNQIETAGFLRQQFEFTFDQPRILDLLTGHTIYNDTGVVLRELLQNAIDAVRLQHF
jgi:hypothetical protein